MARTTRAATPGWRLVTDRYRAITAVEILRVHNDIDSVPLQLDGGAKARRPAAKHEGGAGIDRVSLDQFLSRAVGMAFGHIKIGQGVERGQAGRSGHRRLLRDGLLTIPTGSVTLEIVTFQMARSSAPLFLEDAR